MLGEPLLEVVEREAVASGVLLGDRVPSEVLDGDPGRVVDGLEADVQLGLLAGLEGRIRQVSTSSEGGSHTCTRPISNSVPSS